MANSDRSSSKRQKPRRKPNGNDIDRLSNLPEHILLHILSFLPTENAATTTALSKTFQFLWTSVPTLDFYDYRTHRSGRLLLPSFDDFVTKVFHLRSDQRFLRRFRLRCYSLHELSNLASWVSSAVAQNVQELDIDLGYMPKSHRFRLNYTQPSYNTLVVLKLRSVLIGRTLHKKVSFPILKIFHLEVAEFERRKIKFLQSGFPVLEELIITHNFYIDTKIEIYLPELRSLTLKFMTTSKTVTDLVVNGLLSLVEAKIQILHPLVSRDRVQVSENEDEMYARSVTNVLKAISNARIVKLSHHTMKEIELSSSYSFFREDGIPIFHNVVKVELPFKGRAGESLILVLQMFENLECLTLCYQGDGFWESEYDTKKLIQQTDVPSCLTSHLSTFYFRDFKDTDDAMNVTRYILENSLVLKNMTIFFSSSLSPKEGRCIRRKLRKSHKGSEGCQLEFH